MPLFQLPQLITQLVNARVAITRLQQFLAAPQKPPADYLQPAQTGARALSGTPFTRSVLCGDGWERSALLFGHPKPHAQVVASALCLHSPAEAGMRSVVPAD